MKVNFILGPNFEQAKKDAHRRIVKIIKAKISDDQLNVEIAEAVLEKGEEDYGFYTSLETRTCVTFIENNKGNGCCES
jgi:hypothetical protein